MNKQQIDDIKNQERRKIRKHLLTQTVPAVFTILNYKAKKLPTFFGYVSKKKVETMLKDLRSKLEKDINNSLQ